MALSPQIEQILAQQRQQAEGYDWSTAKGILAAIATARDAIERAAEARTTMPSGRELAAVVEASRQNFRELWEDEAGYGLSTLSEIARALESLDAS